MGGLEEARLRSGTIIGNLASLVLGLSSTMSTGPPPRSPTWLSATAIALVVVTVVAGLFAVVGVFYPRCAGCPGETPLGTALEVGNGTASCPVGNGTSAMDCVYSFPIRAYLLGQGPYTFPTARDLSFRLENSTGAGLDSTYVVFLTDTYGDGIGVWNSSTGHWTVLSTASSCGATDCLSAPLQVGESLLLRSVPTGGLPYSNQGDQLVAEAVAGGFSGTVEAPID
jgi:hypothetical protein